jgi:hypothetical protein
MQEPSLKNHPLSQTQRVPLILERFRRIVVPPAEDDNDDDDLLRGEANREPQRGDGGGSMDDVANPDFLLFQEVHEDSLDLFHEFAEKLAYKCYSAMYNDRRRCYLVTLSRHPLIGQPQFLRTPGGGFNYCLSTTFDLGGGSHVHVINVHLPLDRDNGGERLAATDFVASVASGFFPTETLCSVQAKSSLLRLPFLRILMDAPFRRSVVAGDWNTLPETSRGAKEQIERMYEYGMVDVSEYDVFQFFWFERAMFVSLVVACVLPSFLNRFLYPLSSLLFSFPGVFPLLPRTLSLEKEEGGQDPGGFTTSGVFLFAMTVFSFLWLRDAAGRRRVWKTWTFFGYPNEIQRLQGPQENCQLDRCAVSPGVRCTSFKALRMYLDEKDFRSFSSFSSPAASFSSASSSCSFGDLGFAGSGPSWKKVPVSDHFPVAFDLAAFGASFWSMAVFADDVCHPDVSTVAQCVCRVGFLSNNFFLSRSVFFCGVSIIRLPAGRP